jgi:hypothetical protein
MALVTGLAGAAGGTTSPPPTTSRRPDPGSLNPAPFGGRHRRRRSTSASFPIQATISRRLHAETHRGRISAPCTIRNATAVRQSVCWRLNELPALLPQNVVSQWPSHGSRSPVRTRQWTIGSRTGTRPCPVRTSASIISPPASADQPRTRSAGPTPT